MKKEFCKCCGQPIMKHKHIFYKSLALSFAATFSKVAPNQPFHLQKDLSLTKNQYNNFQKLHYWGIISKHYENGKRLGGYWTFTDMAARLVNGGSVPKWVITFNNEVVETSKEHVRLCDTVGTYDVPEVWAKRAIPLCGDKQLRLALPF